MKLAPQPLRRNLRAKPAPPNLWTCAQRASIDSAIGTFRTLSKIGRAVTVSRSKFFRYRSSDAKHHASKPFRMNTCESVSKQRTLTTFRINTYEKQGEGGPSLPPSHAKPRALGSRSQKPSRFSQCALCLCGNSIPFRHLAPLCPLSPPPRSLFSATCSLFLQNTRVGGGGHRGWNLIL